MTAILLLALTSMQGLHIIYLTVFTFKYFFDVSDYALWDWEILDCERLKRFTDACACTPTGVSPKFPYFLPRRETGGVSDVSHPPCLESPGFQFDPTFLYYISSLVLLSSPLALSVLSFSAFGPISWPFPGSPNLPPFFDRYKALLIVWLLSSCLLFCLSG